MAVFAHGQLRLYLLHLLEAGPRHGYELITALSERFGGTYRPSAGTVYPRLARLEEEGLVERAAAGRKTLYSLTARGRAEVDAHRAELVALEQEIAATVRELAARVRDEVAGSMAGLRADLAAAAQQARATAQVGGRDARAGAAGAARARRSEIDAELAAFRAEVRAAVRESEALGGPSPLTADTVRTVLASARAAIRSTLPR
ncbi:PadR family transcriptional regulator [Cellulomonas sp. Marseille-Q8402]